MNIYFFSLKSEESEGGLPIKALLYTKHSRYKDELDHVDILFSYNHMYI